MSIRLKVNNNKQLVETKQEEEPSCFDDPDPRVSIDTSIDLNDFLPNKYMIGVNLNDLLPDYRDKRKAVKNQKEVDYWNKKIVEQLKLYDSEKDKYNIRLVRGLCQIVERYLIYDTKLGQQKKQIVMNCCLKFFDNNEKLLSAIIDNELENIEKSTLFMRLLARLEIFFFAK
jgi:hypothetical protein